jgi:hypothetical protein
MPKIQRYISDELTHFVGRACSSEDAIYSLLIKIMQSGWITHPPHTPSHEATTVLHVTNQLKHSDNRAYSVSAVCFCDIPIEDLSLHMRKYSRFGIAFKKAYLISKGANPVFYIANNSRLRLANPMTEHHHPTISVAPSSALPHRQDATRGEFFDNALVEFNQYVTFQSEVR